MLRRRPQAGQGERETLETLFRNIDLSFAKNIVLNCFHNSALLFFDSFDVFEFGEVFVEGVDSVES